jgi:hypothetical protein
LQRLFIKKRFHADLIPSFKGKIYELIKEFDKKLQFRLGVFTTSPSAFITNLDRKTLIEVNENVLVAGSGSNAILEFD